MFCSQKKGTHNGARHGKTEAQREYRQAKDCLINATKSGYSSILLRFQQHGESQQAIGWDEDICKRHDMIASGDHSYIAAWYERQRYENNWKLALNTQGKHGHMKVRSDYSDAVRTLRDLRQKDDQEVNSPLLPSQQTRQRPVCENNGDGINGVHWLRLRQNEKGHLLGGLHQNGKNFSFFFSCRSCVRRKRRFFRKRPGVNSTPQFARVTHANTFLSWLKRSSRFSVCIVVRHFSKQSSSQAHLITHAQC